MSTDLFDESGLDTDESDLAWDEFLPDPDEAEGFALDDDLDDDTEDIEESDFDWDALLEDPGPDTNDSIVATSARAAAAFDRILDTVGRSVDPEPEPVAEQVLPDDPELDAELAAEAGLFVGAPPEASTEAPPEAPPEEEEPHAEFLTPAQLDPEADPDGETEPERERATPRGPVHARTRRVRRRERPSRIFMATAALACAFLVVVSVDGIRHSLHHGAAATAGTPRGSSQAASPSPEVIRVQSATDELDSATSAAQAGLASLQGFPTPINVATVINPYIASLRLYETLMSGTNVPLRARSVAGIARAQVGQAVKFFATIDGLPPIRLGAFLQEFMKDAAQLQSTLGALEQDLHAPGSA